jgi:hypothetical protein
MENEQLQNFNERLSEWVASQGFWFQVRYSMFGGGLKGQAMFHLLRLGFRLLILLAFAGVGTWIYLVKRTESARFNESFRNELKGGLSATDLEIRGFSRSQGQMDVSRLAAQGGDETFFTSLEARNIRCKMSLVDGLVGIWKPGTVSILKVNLDLRAGADEAESANKLADSIFRKRGGVLIDAIEVADANITWGYSERTQGAIEASFLKMQRTDAGWRLNFRGGFFQQNWLGGLEIVNLVVLCTPEGLVFEKAELKKGAAAVDFKGLRVSGGERPELSGVAKVRNLGLDVVLPPALRSFVEGSISGDFRVFGSTNTADGIGFEGRVVLDGGDVVSLRERIHLLKALSVVDYSRNYHRVDFREGSFQMKTFRGGMELTDVKLKAEDLFWLDGKMSVRLPTQEEIQTAVTKGGGGAESSPLFAPHDPSGNGTEMPKTAADFTLNKAGQEARRIQEGKQNLESLNLFDRMGLGVEMRRMQEQVSERMSRMLRYDGSFRVSIPGDAFERAPQLQELYPADPASGRVSIRVPVEGHLYELTLKQAEDVYQKGLR